MVRAICGRNNRGAGSEISDRLNNEPKLQRDRHCMASFESASRWDFGEDFTPEGWRMAVESRESGSGPGGRRFESSRPDHLKSMTCGDLRKRPRSQCSRNCSGQSLQYPTTGNFECTTSPTVDSNATRKRRACSHAIRYMAGRPAFLVPQH
jgi:hypothetical protein